MSACSAWRALRRVGAALLLGAAAALVAPAQAGVALVCRTTSPLGPAAQSHLLQLSAVVRQTLDASASPAVLISRSGMDLSRFGIRYSHAAIAWRNKRGEWSARQLYYDCDEGRPRLYDQGLAGFVLGMDDPRQSFISIVPLPQPAAQAVRDALLDEPRALRLLAARYSANAYAWGLAFQNCNQWVMELLAAAWGGLPDGDDLRARAQRWLRDAGYAPDPVRVDSHALMFAAGFVPLLHLRDHPEDDRFALRLHVSLPSTIEAFVHQRVPQAQRTELCLGERGVVVRAGWGAPLADACQAGEGDRVLPVR